MLGLVSLLIVSTTIFFCESKDDEAAVDGDVEKEEEGKGEELILCAGLFAVPDVLVVAVFTGVGRFRGCPRADQRWRGGA